MSRRRRQRALALRQPEPLDRQRALAKFRHLKGRGIEIEIATFGPVVTQTDALTPSPANPGDTGLG